MRDVRNLTRRLLALLPALLLGAGLLTGPTIASAAADTGPDNAYVLRVDGLACPYCGYGVEKVFSKQKGVKGTQIDLASGVVKVLAAPGTRFSDSELKQWVDDAGFELAGIVSRPKGQ